MSITATNLLESINPATGEVVGSVPITPVDEIHGVVAKARDAQPAWNALGLDGRLALMQPIAKRLAEKASEIGELMTAEMGKSTPEAQGECAYGAEKFSSELSSAYEAFQPEEMTDEHTRSILYRDPLGVSVAITPWNFPMLMPQQSHPHPTPTANDPTIKKFYVGTPRPTDVLPKQLTNQTRHKTTTGQANEQLHERATKHETPTTNAAMQ